MTRLKHPAGATIVPDVCRDWVSGMKIPSRLGSKRLALENSEADLVIRFLRVPAILHSINSNEEQAIRDRVDSGAIRSTEILEIAPHVASFFGDE